MAMTLQDIYRVARASGLDDEGARVAVAIAQTEGGLSGAVGDNGQSFGPYQFYTQGMLPGYAAALKTDVRSAGEYARQHPDHAAQWALSGYLGQAIKQGQKQGLSGADLATYAQATGQRSESPERAGANYATLFAGGAPTPAAGGGGEEPDPLAELYPDQPPTGGTPMADGEVDTGVSNRSKAQQSNPILDNLFGKKGAYASVVQTNKGQKGTWNDALGDYEPAPPTYRYQWDDGTYADVTPDGKVTGTALQGLKASANKPTAPKISRFPDGTMRQYDPSTDTWDVVGEAPDVSASKQNAFTASQNAANRDLQKYMADLQNQIATGRLTLDEAQTQFNQGLANYQFKNARQGMAGGLFNQANEMMLQGSKFAAPPNRNTFPGFGPGEGAAVASKLLGAKFTPAEFTRINFDPRGDIQRVLTGGYDWPDIPGTVYPGYQKNWGGGGGLPTPPSAGGGYKAPPGAGYNPNYPQFPPDNLPAPSAGPRHATYEGALPTPTGFPIGPTEPSSSVFPTPYQPTEGSSYVFGQSNLPAPSYQPTEGSSYVFGPVDPVTGQPLLPQPQPYTRARMR